MPCPLATAAQGLDSQALTALGAARVDHSTATARFHANQETVGTGTADFGRLVSTFHVGSLRRFSICVGKALYLRPTIQVLRRTLSPSSPIFFHMSSMSSGLQEINGTKHSPQRKSHWARAHKNWRPAHITLNTFRETCDYHSVGPLMQ